MIVPPRRLVLASASPARLRLLHDAGFDPTVIVSGVDEENVSYDDPFELVRALAELKAQTVAGTVGLTDAVVLGCDSMFLLEGDVLGKPASAEDAIARWKRMPGCTGVLSTVPSLVVFATGRG